MSAAFEFVRHDDRPALLALSTPDWLVKVRPQLSGLGYLVHVAADHEDFIARYGQVHYHLVVFEELFAATAPAENLSLPWFQNLPMSQRRHSVALLLGENFVTLNPLQAWQQSVHAVVNPTEIESFGQIVQKVTAENDLLLQNLLEVTRRLARGEK
jgi:hypothetical protein